MNKTIILYQSRYGTTELCAKMLESQLNCDIENTSVLTSEQADSYDTIIYMGYVQVGKIKGYNAIKEQFQKYKEKNLILCAVGMTNPDDTKQIDEMWNANLDTASRDYIKPFYLLGGFDYSKMKFFHKQIINVIINSLVKKEVKNEYDKKVIAAKGKRTSFVTESAIAPIKDYILAL